jgi:large subunit ribosomal protein L3
MKTILGTKENMTQIFDDKGVVHPVTAIVAGPVVVIGKKTKDKEKYNAIVVGFGSKSEKNINKAQKGQFKDLGNFRYVKEFKATEEQINTINIGDKIELSAFLAGDTIEISSYSKGKGFQGVVKRHGFKGGPRSHGQKHSEREPGSIGGGGRSGGRVIRGMRMAGRMGSDRVTLKNVKVVATDLEKGMLYVQGSIPGRRGTLIEIIG